MTSPASVRPAGGAVGPLTLGGELLQVLQSCFFVSRTVSQAVIDHRVLKRHKHSAHQNPQNQLETSRTWWTIKAMMKINSAHCTHTLSKKEDGAEGHFSTAFLWLWQWWAVAMERDGYSQLPCSTGGFFLMECAWWQTSSSSRCKRRRWYKKTLAGFMWRGAHKKC